MLFLVHVCHLVLFVEQLFQGHPTSFMVEQRLKLLYILSTWLLCLSCKSKEGTQPLIQRDSIFKLMVYMQNVIVMQDNTLRQLEEVDYCPKQYC